MKKILCTAFLLISVFVGSVAQENATAKSYGDQLTAADLKEYLTIVASDALEGRQTGTRGQKMAAALIANHFQELGLVAPVNGTYYQPFDLYSSRLGEVYMTVDGKRNDQYSDIYYSGSASTGGETSIDVVFVGRGTADDYAQVDVKDKAVVQLTSAVGGPRATIRGLSQVARDHGAKILYLVADKGDEEYRKYVDERKANPFGGGLSLKKPDPSMPDKGVFLISHGVAEKIFKSGFDKLVKAADDAKKKSLKKVKIGKVAYRVTVQVSNIKTENVLGYLEGSDKKDELVVVTAHYDHIGKKDSGDDKINNGADDDGSGTVSVMEMAKIFAKAKSEGHGPRRSMLFMTVVAEEQGLLGSEYYCDHPVYPLVSTVVDLNIDMIGRSDAEHKDKGNYVYVIGSDRLSSELHALSEKTNATYTKLSFDYTYNDEHHPTNLYQRSDHWNFAKNSIPIVFYFDGIHEDYHRPSDEVSKIDFDLLALRAKCVFYTAWEIANRDNRLVVDKK